MRDNLRVNKCSTCQSCGPVLSPSFSEKGRVLIVGNLNVGKTTLFARLVRAKPESMNVPGSTVTVQAAPLPRSRLMLLDSPGTYSIFADHDDEIASRDVLLASSPEDGWLGILLVADAKNLKRSIALALQYMEYGLPMAVVVNMIDEAVPRGIHIDYAKLSEALQLDILPTVAREGLGVLKVVPALSTMRVPPRLVTYPPRVEQFADLTAKLLDRPSVSPHVIALLLLAGDRGIAEHLRREVGTAMLAQLQDLAEDFRRQESGTIAVTLGTLYRSKAEQIVNSAVTVERASPHPLAVKLGDWSAQLHTGIPIAFLVIGAMYLFVGMFGGGMLVDWIRVAIFEQTVTPFAARLLAPLPSAFVRDLLLDPSFGVLPTGVFLALGLVMPVMFCFYLAFGVLEESGYLPRLSILLDRVFRRMGLNGKGVVPLAMGFSCVTMAILTTRVLDTEKEKNIASLLLFLAVPCAPQIAVMLTLLERMPLSATLTVFGLVAAIMFGAGFLADAILPGERTPLLLEIPPLRLPRPGQLLRMAALKTYFFMKEAVPVFVLASAVVFLFNRLGGLQVLQRALQPVTGSLLGLPEASIQVFIKTLVRRESGAAELINTSAQYTNLQLVVCLVVMTFLVPCVNATLVLYKERGFRATATIAGLVSVSAIAIGSVVNHLCHALGINFT